jgi:short subunit dehydrogenase-like uncharacterized protein
MSGADFMLYGSNGYVGRAVAELAIEHDLRPMLCGRDESAVNRQANELGMEARVFGLDDEASLNAALAAVPVVLNCAGPFLSTHRPLVDACLRTGTHYLDITGEPPVYEAIAARDDEAGANGVMLLPGVGFDVVPTDCLAAHLKRRLPTATHLTLAFHPEGPAALPPGTLKTLIDLIPLGSNKERRVDGRLEVVSGRRPTRMIDFGSGPIKASLLSWGDIHQAYRSTGIPNIEDYAVLPPGMGRQMDVTEKLRPLFRIAAVREAAKRTIRGGATGEERARTTMSVWGEVVDGEGQQAVSRMHGPEGGLVWTSRSALEVVKRVLGGDFKPGSQTPSLVYGPDLALASEGVTREDIT